MRNPLTWLRDKLAMVLDVVTAYRDADQPSIPPMPLCLICHKRTTWLAVSKVFICPEGHRFTPSVTIDT